MRRNLSLLVAATLAACGGATVEPPAAPPNETVTVTSPTGRARDVTPPPPPPPPPVTTPPPAPGYSGDATLRLNEIQMKGAHNSYHVASDAPNAPAWTQYTLPSLTAQLNVYGVRQFELDVHYYGGRFLVFHLPDLDQRSTCQTLRACLNELRDWSYAHPGHQPLFVWLELKDEWDPEKIAPHIDVLEAEVRGAIPREKLLTPDDVRRGYATLRDAITRHGWPTLGEARGKFVFVVMNEGDGRYAYTYGGASLDNRAMFVTAQGGPYGVVAMIDDVMNQVDAIYAAAAQGMLVRSRVDDLPGRGGGYAEQLAAALRQGAHMIATDYPVDDTIPGYAVEIPGGMPSRCNPVTATPACAPLLIENPALLAAPP